MFQGLNSLSKQRMKPGRSAYKGWFADLVSSSPPRQTVIWTSGTILTSSMSLHCHSMCLTVLSLACAFRYVKFDRKPWKKEGLNGQTLLKRRSRSLLLTLAPEVKIAVGDHAPVVQSGSKFCHVLFLWVQCVHTQRLLLSSSPKLHSTNAAFTQVSYLCMSSTFRQDAFWIIHLSKKSALNWCALVLCQQ